MTTQESEVDVLAWIDAATVAVGIVADGADTKMKRLAKPVRDAVAGVFEALKASADWMETATVESWNDDPPLAQARTALRNAGVKV